MVDRRVILLCACASFLVAGRSLGAPAPSGVTLPGTLMGAAQHDGTDGGNANWCLLNPVVLTTGGGSSFSTAGPSVGSFRRDGAVLTLSLPGLSHGVTRVSGGVNSATFDYYSTGIARLVFTGGNSGTIEFLPGGVTYPNAGISPAFSGYVESFGTVPNRLFVSFAISMGDCWIPFRATFQA